MEQYTEQLETKHMQFYKVISILVVICISETWVVSKQDQKKVQLAERFLRCILGFTDVDRKCIDMRKKLNTIRNKIIK